ncbi:phospholipase D-like domain-containing protein [Halomonas sp. PR-M31]|uniref:phospholipase D-like domain-containing protein n=1 Tax=Halomonas sp. PR-M31 TaxID=1471202 RepID=UPI000B32C87A|nr:phospholipase D-like domain-containing protein [Halomonas sp. PR-M31]
MEVLYWQAFVAGSTIIAYLFKSRNWGASVAGLWSLWTLAMLGYAPLITTQLISAWGAFFVVDSFTKKSRQIKKFEATLTGYHKEDQKALITARKENHFILLTDSSHYEYMLAEIDRSKSTIMILSGWISDKVIDERFISIVKKALQRGVQVYLGFGFENSQGRHEITRPAKRALLSLQKLSKTQQQLHVGKFNNHQKALVIDQKRVVCGSHNWLSNKAFKNREQSFIIDDQTAAKAVFEHSMPLILENPAFDT